MTKDLEITSGELAELGSTIAGIERLPVIEPNAPWVFSDVHNLKFNLTEFCERFSYNQYTAAEHRGIITLADGEEYLAVRLWSAEHAPEYHHGITLYFDKNLSTYTEDGVLKEKDELTLRYIEGIDKTVADDFDARVRYFVNFRDTVSREFADEVFGNQALSGEEKTLLIMAKSMTNQIDAHYKKGESNIFIIGEGHGDRISLFLDEVCRLHINKYYDIKANFFEIAEDQQKFVDAGMVPGPEDARLTMLRRTILDGQNAEIDPSMKPDKIILADEPMNTTPGYDGGSKERLAARDDIMREKIEGFLSSKKAPTDVMLNCGMAHMILGTEIKVKDLNVVYINTHQSDMDFTDLFKKETERYLFARSDESVIKAYKDSFISDTTQGKFNGTVSLIGEYLTPPMDTMQTADYAKLIYDKMAALDAHLAAVKALEEKQKQTAPQQR